MAKRVTAAGPVEAPWALPEGWRWEPLGSLGTWSGGGTPSKARPEFWSDGTVPWVSPKDMKRPLIDSSEDTITVAAVNGSSAKMIPAGSVLCVMRSGILRHTFPVAVNTIDVTLNQDMRALNPRSDIDPRYLAYYLRFTGNTVLHTASKAGTTVNSIEASRLDRHAVPVVDFDRQRTIVARIDELFAEIDDGEAALARARDDLATWRKALLKAAVTGDLTADWRAAQSGDAAGPSTPSTSTRCPREWTRTTIGKLASLQGGPAFKSSDYSPNGTFLVRIGDITDGLVTASQQSARLPNGFRDESARFIVQAGDILIAMSGATTAKFGRYNGAEPALLNQRVGRFNIAEKAMLSADYLAIWLGHQQGKILAAAYGGAQPNISSGAIEAMSIDLPPAAEQAEIVSRLQSSLGHVSERSADLRELAPASSVLRQSILAAAFRGDLA